MDESTNRVTTPAGYLMLLGFVACATLAATLAPIPVWSRDVLYLGVQFLAATAGAVAIVRNKPSGPLRSAWIMLDVGLFGYFSADCLWLYYARTGQDPYPSPADFLFVASTLLMIRGATRVVRARRQEVSDRGATFDTTVLGGAVAAALWVLIVQPSAAGADASGLELVFGVAYPALDILLALVIVRLVIAGGQIPQSLRLFFAGLVTLTAADTAYYAKELTGSYVEWGFVDAGYMLSFGLLAAAMWHPSMRVVADMPESRPLLGRPRLVLLCLGAITPLLLMVLRLDSPVIILTLVATSIGLFLVLVVRSWSLVDRVRELTRQRDDQRFSALVQHSADAIVVADLEGVVKTASDTLRRSWAVASDDHELGAQQIDHWIAVEDRERFADFRHRVSALDPGDSSRIRVRMSRAEGTGHAEVVGANLLDNDDIAGVVLTVRDITDRTMLENELRHQAEHDLLTGLANRALFNRTIQRELMVATEGEEPALLLLDVDDFKRVNDELGHHVGDLVLEEFAARLKATLPPFALAARLGGDEFAVLVPASSSIGSVGGLAQRIASAVCQPITADEHILSMSTSIGISIATRGQDREALVREADAAMYVAKAAGRGRIQPYTTTLAAAVETELSLRRGLAKAKGAGQLRVVYQTIVNAASGEPTMIEALLRWDHPERGPIPPDVFIPIADSSGLIDEIGLWVLNEACTVGAEVERDVRTAVNISLRQLRSATFVNDVIRTLHSTSLPASSLVLEIGLDALVEPQVSTRLEQLRRYGVQIALEKFGSNYATLTRLGSLAVDIVKIDQHLMDDEHISPALVSAIIKQAAKEGVEVVIQGVETEDLRRAFELRGVDNLQGFAISRPVDSRDVVKKKPASTRSA